MLALVLMLQAASADIVIRGDRLAEAHERCVKGGCTPLRDAQTTVALAEEKFGEGDYRTAKHVLARAISRNKANVAEAPRAVAALYEAFATVSLHEGDQNAYRHAMATQVNLLRENLSADDDAVVAATTWLGDMWMKLNQPRRAEIAFRSAEQQALRSGIEPAILRAGIKRAWYYASVNKMTDALSKIDEIEARPGANDPDVQTVLQVLRLRIAARDANDAKIDELITRVSSSEQKDPVLLWAPDYEREALAEGAATALRLGYPLPVQTQSSDYSRIQWADIGFWIGPDGRTSDIDILRSSPTPTWTRPVLSQIARRRYAPALGTAAGSLKQGSYRVERITRRTKYTTPIGSIISRRIATGDFEVLDLTANNAAPGVTR